MEPECVTAVCCLGFPLLSLDGYRGQNIDPLLDVKCPVFIAVGSAAANSDIDELEDMRDQFKCKSKLLVVEGADSLLRVPTDIQLKNKECHFKFQWFSGFPLKILLNHYRFLAGFATLALRGFSKLYQRVMVNLK